jgi:hypothetical protein
MWWWYLFGGCDTSIWASLVRMRHGFYVLLMLFDPFFGCVFICTMENMNYDLWGVVFNFNFPFLYIRRHGFVNDGISIIMRMTHEELEIWGALLKDGGFYFFVKQSFSIMNLNGGSSKAIIVVIIWLMCEPMDNLRAKHEWIPNNRHKGYMGIKGDDIDGIIVA